MRYPFEAIDVLFPYRSEGQPTDPLGLAALLGTSNTELSRWRRDGMSVVTADRVAVSLGFHPSQLWPSWFDDTDNDPRCRWCGEPRLDGRYCDGHRALFRREKNVDRYREAKWWERIDRYRESIVILEEVA